MNLKNVYLKFILILLLFINCCLAQQNESNVTTSFGKLKTSNLLSNLIDEVNHEQTNENTIENLTTNQNLTSTHSVQQVSSQSTGDHQSDHLLNLIRKKQIDSKLIDDDQQLNSLDVVNKIKVCNETTEYSCKNDDKCIDKELVCDGFKDCVLGDDELNCNHNCSIHHKFQCKSDGKCIDMIFKCNSFPDCSDGSDEEDCENSITECSKDEFECSSGGCIHMNKVCDKTNDCLDGSDELFCRYTCASNEFQCKNDLKCIPESLRCNNQKDCLDGSDEDCPNNNNTNYTCGPNEFSCQTEPKKCIDKILVCDGVDDCGNNFDEPLECNMDLCKNHHCSHECKQERNIAKCICKSGFKLSSNGIDCEDINECLEIPSFCSGHECINLNGSATCNCGIGYRYNENENRCKVINGRNATIIYSNQNELRNTSLSIKSYLPSLLKMKSDEQKNDIVRQNLNAIGMFVYDFNDNFLIWHDMNERRFYISALDQTKRPIERNEFWTKFKLPQPHHHRTPRTPLNRNQHYVLLENITNVEGMTLDYVHDLLYWTDTDRNVIEVMEVRNPNKRRILVDTDLDEPKGIVVDVERSFLLFSDWGNKPRIEYIKQDGTGRRTIYDKNLEWPYSIALDSYLDKIYWVDTKKNTLNVVDFDGENHKVLLTNPMYLERANDLDVFEDKVYWSDQESESILSIDKFKPKSTLSVLVKDLKNVLSSKIVHYSKQNSKMNNLCAQTDCEFLCLPRNDLKSHTCACPATSSLNVNDKRSCKTDKISSDAVTKDNLSSSFLINFFGHDSNRAIYIANTSLIYILALAILMILLVALICFYFLYNYAKKRANKLKFNNAEYQKTPQQDEKLPACMEPLNTSTNQFV